MEKNIKDIESDSEPQAATDETPDPLATCTKERDEYLDGWRRAKADLINYKKEEQTRFETMAKFATEDLLRDILPVLDSFDMAIGALEREGRMDKGLYHVQAQFEDVVRKRGLERIRVRPGDAFDPGLHEGLGYLDSDLPPDTIAVEIEAGYQLYGRVVRPARVKLASKKKESNA